LLTSSFFSLKAKLRLLKEPFVKASEADKDESLAEFVERRFGKEVLDYAINPFVAGVYAGDPESLSVRHAFPKLHALEQRYGSILKGQIQSRKEARRKGEMLKSQARLFSFDAGMQVLTDRLTRCRGRTSGPAMEDSWPRGADSGCCASSDANTRHGCHRF
jgi:oxygen-dependent protoporphyrinogen oxidase